MLRCLCAVIAAAMMTGQAFAQTVNPNAYGALHWRSIGPFRGGRTVAIGGIAQQPNVFYMAPTNGGVWKTTDSGRTWNSIFDEQPTQSVGALAIAPSAPETVYVGSGEGLQRPDLSTGDGIYKTTDGGASWHHLGLRDAQQIGAIAVDPHDSNRLFVAALGHPYGPNAERGVYRSTDGGASFQKVLDKGEHVGAIAVVLDPANAQIVYASMWSARHSPWSAGGSLERQDQSGLYKSIDGGTTWQQLTGGLPKAVGRIGIGIAPSNPNRIYTLVDGDVPALYRSDDAGAHWTRVNTEERITSRGADFAGVTVDPSDQNTVWIANTSTYRSTDAGKTFTAIKGAPGGDDYHTIWFNPLNPQIIALACDQGATISVNGGRTWSSWYNQPTGQFFHVITDNQFPYWVYGGQQESGSAGTASRSDYGEISFRDWHPVGIDEYGYAAPDPLHPNIIYGGKAQRYDSRTGEVQEISPVVFRSSQYRFNRTAPIMFSPTDPHTLYLASSVLFKTRDGGHSWHIISPDLTRANPGVPPNLRFFENTPQAKRPHRGVIYALAPSPVRDGVIWAGTDEGLLWRTADGGKHWRNVTPPALNSWSKVAQLDASHFDANTVYAAVNRFRLDDLHPYIYRTHDAGKTWQLTVTGLPDGASVNTVREDPKQPGLLFAGTERGVSVSFDDGARWQSLRLNLPATSMRDLVVHGDDIVVGTHGRSFWILDNITPLRQIAAQHMATRTQLFTPALAYRLRWNENTDTPLPPEEPAGQNPPDGAMIDYYLTSAAQGPVRIDIRDAAGHVVRRFSSTDSQEPVDPGVDKPTYWIRPTQIPGRQAGMHRFVWDLHYPAPRAASHDYPISAIYHNTPREPRGVVAVPGLYSVELTVDGRSYTQPLRIKMDPRIQMTQSQLQTQFALATQIVAAMNRSAQFAAAAKSPEKRDVLLGLNDALARLLSLIDGVDRPPTVQALQALNVTLGQLKALSPTQ